MSDLIIRSALIEEFRKCHISFNGTPMEESDMLISYRSLARVINRQPTVEAKPVVKGEWLYERETYNTCSAWKCSNCGECYGLPFIKDEYNFCPECGADMRGGKNERKTTKNLVH